MSAISSNSIRQLRRYASNELDMQGLYEWLLSAEYSASLSLEERDIFAEIRSVAMEVADGAASKLELDRMVITAVLELSNTALVPRSAADISLGINSYWFVLSWEGADTYETEYSLVDTAEPVTPAEISLERAGDPREDQSPQVLVGSPQ